jgi:L-alanine-DL-glutamate epimerase-like enolase superfamily enzyme
MTAVTNRRQVTGLRAAAHRVPLDHPESDGTLAWTATSVVTVHVDAGDESGLGWTYGPAAIAGVIDELLGSTLIELDPCDIPAAHLVMRRATRNATTPGLVSLAISAVDVALWDLKARLLGVPLTRLLGQARPRVPLYGSGGFISLTDNQLATQLRGWVSDGLSAVKIKIAEDRGQHQSRDLHRIRLARTAIGPDTILMVDANGGYDTKAALRLVEAATDERIGWFEEPVSSDRLTDLALLRGMTGAEITAGEYGTTIEYFNRMCGAGAVDCLQIDASRCGGYTGFLAAAAVADAYGLSVSSHCAPTLHAPVCAAVPNLRHAEWFADHVRADQHLFAGLASPVRGALVVQVDRPGHGITLRPEVEREAGPW